MKTWSAAHALGTVITAMAMLCIAQAGYGTGASKPSREPLEDLRRIGTEVSRAVLAKDVEGVLRYVRADLREEDRQLLKDRTSDLYCYVFGSSCGGQAYRSVYDVLRTATPLTIQVWDLPRARTGDRAAILLFFQQGAVDERKVRRDDTYRCAVLGKQLITWQFVYRDGRWESNHPPFDAETDYLCDPDE
jgi:hypothetical protein